MKAYSAGLMSQSFWFIEFKKVVKLVSDGKSQNDIKAACVEENLLGAVNPYRAKRVAGYSKPRAILKSASSLKKPGALTESQKRLAIRSGSLRRTV